MTMRTVDRSWALYERASTVIPMRLPASAESPTLRIYNLAGQTVRTLLPDRPGVGGYHEVTWNGRDDRGLAVASGVYIRQAGK